MDRGLGISVVVASYNRCAGLEQLLRALAHQTYPSSRFEVIVIDDGSTDGTRELLATIVVPYALRSLTQANRGPAAARNLGVELARGRLILFLDDDVIPVPQLLADHDRAHGGASHRVVVGPMLPPPSSWKQPAWDRWDAEQLRKQYQAMLSSQYQCSQRQFFTANASVHSALLEAAGGFDDTFRRAEDVELAWRMSRRGAEFVFEPRAEVVHFASRPFKSWCRNAQQYGRYDVVMEREKQIPVFSLACREFRNRRSLNQWLARICVGRAPLRKATLRGLEFMVRVTDRFGAHRIASLALSSIFNVQYWQGACEEVGGPVMLWAAVAIGSVPVVEDGVAHHKLPPESHHGVARALAGMPALESREAVGAVRTQL